MFDIVETNARLKRLYGNRIDINLPNFRLVEARGLTERRYGTYRIETESGIFLREETGWSTVLKYPDDQNFLVLERLFPNPHVDELLGEKFSYEPIWIFKYDNEKKRVPNHAVDKMVDMIMRRLIDQRNEPKKTQKDITLEEQIKVAKQKQEIEDSIDTTPVTSAFHDGGAVFVDSTKRFKNVRNDRSLIVTP